LPGASVPETTHTPAITQPPQVLSQVSVATLQTALLPHWFTGAEQASVSSLHVEMPLQATPSSQLRGVPVQEPPRQISPTVQKSWSSHVASSLLDQPPGSRVGSQIRQGFAGWMALAATHSPAMKQPGQVASQAPASPSQSGTEGQLPLLAQSSSAAVPSALWLAFRFAGLITCPSLEGSVETFGALPAAPMGAGWFGLVTCGGLYGRYSPSQAVTAATVKSSCPASPAKTPRPIPNFNICFFIRPATQNAGDAQVARSGAMPGCRRISPLAPTDDVPAPGPAIMASAP